VSTTERLDTDFNSLDAQREAAEAYIESQKSEGWVCLPERYDDGGYSGGNMERPALVRLLDFVKAGNIDCIVVYKVDRLSRSIRDFSKIVEILEDHNVSFVSVTQHFNTTNSMGRLTLNILLSFAQFEREMISERTRDKMSAARRKGKWVGGRPVLGYDVHPDGGRLIVNQDEAMRVRRIFELYLEYESLISTAQELSRRGWTTKQWVTKRGKECGGSSFTKTNLHHHLTNFTYVGKVFYQNELYDGEHDPIIEADLWKKVQDVLRRNGRNGGKLVRNRYGALLKGLLYCVPCGTAMIHTFTPKGKKQYRYYVCSHAQKMGWDSCPTKSLPAGEIEAFVVDRIRCIGKDPAIIAETLKQARSQTERRIAELENDRRLLDRELKQYNTEVNKLVKSMGQKTDGESVATARLADLQERIRDAKLRSSTIRDEILVARDEIVDEGELTAALSQFDPVWESLAPREQARVIRLLVERIGFDGEKQTIALTFRQSGIKALAQEAAVCMEET